MQKAFVAKMAAQVRAGGRASSGQLHKWLEFMPLKCRCGRAARTRVGVLGFCSAHDDEGRAWRRAASEARGRTTSQDAVDAAARERR